MKATGLLRHREWTRRANTGREQVQQSAPYSITSSLLDVRVSPRKRTSIRDLAMSHRCPTTDACTAAACSFDDFVGAGEQRRRHIEAERLGGLEVDHQLEFAGLYHR